MAQSSPTLGKVTRDLIAFHVNGTPRAMSPSHSPDIQACLGGDRRQRTVAQERTSRQLSNYFQWQSCWSQGCTGNIVGTDLSSGSSEKDSGGSFHFIRILFNGNQKWNISIFSRFCYVIYWKKQQQLESTLGRSLCPVSYLSRRFQDVSLQGCFYHILTRKKWPISSLFLLSSAKRLRENLVWP